MTHRPPRRPGRTARYLLRVVLDHLDGIGDQLADANRHINKINTKLETFMTATQDQLDAITAQIDQARADFAESATGIQGDLDRLIAQVGEGQVPDFTAILASVGALTDQAQAFKAIDAENPAPPEPPVE